MTIDDNERLQAKLGVTADGQLGRISFTKLFLRLGANETNAASMATSAAVSLDKYGISQTPLRMAHFFAQASHESGHFHYMEEIASGAAYEGRKDLGNINPGDGKRYKGRGPIELTGRNNYRRYGKLLGIDLEANPEMVATPSLGFTVACLFWQLNNLNQVADADNINLATRIINGGNNGLADREALLITMKQLFC